jgi:hypothetical protein
MAGSLSGNLKGISLFSYLLKLQHAARYVVKSSCFNSSIAQVVGIRTIRKQCGNNMVGQHVCQAVATQHVDVANLYIFSHLYNIHERRRTSASDTVGDDI